MRTKAIRMYGENDLRLEEFDLPEIKENEILAKVICDSVCMSTYKAVSLGDKHKRVPSDVNTNPVMIGHELAGEIISVGENYKDKYFVGQKFCIQPALNDPQNPYFTPGYSFKHIGGMATYIIIPSIVISQNCLIPFQGDSFYKASLAEPMSCIIGGFNTNFHTEVGEYNYINGIKKDGSMAILAGGGPMGLGAIDYALNSDIRPSVLVVTDINQERIDRAKKIYSSQYADLRGVKLHFVNTNNILLSKISDKLISLSKDGEGFDDVFVYAISKDLVMQGDSILARGACLNFFAGPTDEEFSAPINFYNVHYKGTHFVGNSGGNTDDMRLALDLTAQNKINPSSMITHIGGLDSGASTVMDLPILSGGKKIIYTHIDMPLTAIKDFEELGVHDSFFAELNRIVTENNGLWCTKAEEYLLSNKLGVPTNS